MGLFGVFGKKKKAKKAAKKAAKKSVKKSTKKQISKVQSSKKTPIKTNEPLNKLTAKGELPWGWYSANLKFTQKIDAEFSYFSNNVYNAKTVKEKLSALKSLVQYQEDVKKLCHRKGECFEYWASASITNPVNMEQNKQELKRMERDLDKLLEQEKWVDYFREVLPSVISKEPGVIQTDLYKRYDPSCKSIISNELYQMESRGQIVRKKSGRSYALYLK